MLHRVTSKTKFSDARNTIFLLFTVGIIRIHCDCQGDIFEYTNENMTYVFHNRWFIVTYTRTDITFLRRPQLGLGMHALVWIMIFF